MDRSTILRELERIVRGVLDDPEVALREDMLFEHAGDWDSFAQTQTIVRVESRFNILFDLDELASVSTVGALVDSIDHKLAVQGRL